MPRIVPSAASAQSAARRRIACPPFPEYARAIQSKHVAPLIRIVFRVLLHPCFSHHRAGLGGWSECRGRLTPSGRGSRYSAALAETLVQSDVVGPRDQFHIRYFSRSCLSVEGLYEPGLLHQAGAHRVRCLELAADEERSIR